VERLALDQLVGATFVGRRWGWLVFGRIGACARVRRLSDESDFYDCGGATSDVESGFQPISRFEWSCSAKAEWLSVPFRAAETPGLHANVPGDRKGRREKKKRGIEVIADDASYVFDQHFARAGGGRVSAGAGAGEQESAARPLDFLKRPDYYAGTDVVPMCSLRISLRPAL